MVLWDVIRRLAGDFNGEMSLESKLLWRERKKLVIMDGILMRQRYLDNEKQLQLVLPKKYWKQALSLVHSDMGHLGRDRVLELLRDRYFWVGMTKFVAEFISKCERCVREKFFIHLVPVWSILKELSPWS